MDHLRLTAITLVGAIILGFAEATQKWGYRGAGGPDKWPAIEGRCGGDKQSPINIYTHQVVYDRTLGNLVTSNYDKSPTPGGWMIKNNGHTATITGTFNESSQPSMYGGSLPSQYDFLNMHFHWGKDENPGSEHLFNYKRYPAELHIVHVRRDFAANGSDDWQEESTGLAVLSVIIDVGPATNFYFEPIIDALRTIRYADQAAPVKNMQLRDFLPNRAENMVDDLPFFRYMGSLTTPDCFESVIWTVLQKHVYISPRQYRQLQKLNEVALPSARMNEIADSVPGGHHHDDENEDDDDIVNNYRPVQPLNGRIVLANREIKHGDSHYVSSAASWEPITAVHSFFFVLFAVLRYCFFSN